MNPVDVQHFSTSIEPPLDDLATCALLIARILEYPQLDVDHYERRLDDLAYAAGRLFSPGMPRFDQAELLATFLFTMEGFRGNTADYGDPRNSFLNEILDRHLGIPITLSLLYMTIAGRLGIPVQGIGLPGHFIVAVLGDTRAERLLLDPFHAGLRLTPEDCAQLVSKTTGYQGNFLAQWLDPTPPLLIVARMLNNLRVGYLRQERWEQARQVVKLLQITQPTVYEHIRDEGLIAFQEKEFRLAAELLDQYLAEQPHAADKAAIQKGIADSLDRWARQN